ncbi:MAG: ABC transporter ATP-binding protein [Bacilli bacterium]|nr:ABC transporter ATP-binding protein [Bacilli bacterium]
MEILRCKNLSKLYGNGSNQVCALKNVNLSIKKGEFVAIKGKSGSGKSTLLHLLAGIDTPSNGEVIINNKNIYKISDKELTIFRRKNIGVIYQFYNLIPNLSIKENILLPRVLDKRTIDDKVFSRLINNLGISNKLDFFPNDLSGGEQQRCAIGRALINRPKILFADEPTGNLDSKNSLKIMKLLKFYNKKFKQTIVMVTHDDYLASMCDRIITMKDGKIVSDKKNTSR